MCICFSCIFSSFSQEKPVKIIFDTDMGPDYDDVGAMALLHAFADCGEAEILATLSSNQYANCAPCIDVLNHYFQRPDIPIGAPKQGPDVIDQRFKGREYWAEELPKRYPHKIKATSDAPDAVDVYRRILSRQPDKSVTIVTVGFFTNLSGLLDSQPDKHSRLNGKELVKRKVKRLVSMAGSFPEGREFNVFIDSTASAKVFAEWPTSILISGFQIGEKILTGKRLVASTIEGSPVKDAFGMCLNTDVNGRCSWDQTAVLVAIKGYEPYFDIDRGTMTVLPDGSNKWVAAPHGKHAHLTWKMPAGELTTLIEDLMMHQPQKSKKTIANNPK